MQETVSTILDEVRRAWPYRWQGLFIAVLFAAVGSVTTLLLPDMYSATAQIAVLRSNDQAILPIHNAQIRFLSDATLDTVISRVDFGVDLSSSAARERLKEQVKSRVTLEGTDTELFIIRCADSKPQRAREVCVVLLEAFQDSVAQNGDTTALNQQLVDGQLALNDAERRLQAHRTAHLDVFGQGGIAARLDTARAAEEKAGSDFEFATQRRDQLQALWRQSRSDASVSASSSLTPLAGEPLIDRLYAAYTELEGLRSRYSENHPDVILARRQIETIVQQYPPDVRMCSRGASKAATTESAAPSAIDDAGEMPVIDRQTIDTVAANIAVCRALSTFSQAEDDVDTLTAINSSAPPIEAELNRLTAERDSLKDRVDGMRQRIQELNVGDPESLYSVVGTPQVPRAPTSPNRRLLLAGVLLGGLFGGGAGAYLRGALSSALVSPAEVRRLYKLPYFGSVSEVNGLRSRLDQSTQLFSFLIALGAIVAAMLFLILADPYITIARQWVLGVATSLVQLSGFIK
jgi:uncharacterized protein involved in exopolysaccharide biosynthesis